MMGIAKTALVDVRLYCFIIVVAVLSLATGCAGSDSSEAGWSVGGDAGLPEVDSESPAPDLGRGSFDATTKPDAPDCRPQIISTGFIEGADRPEVMDGSIYFEQDIGDGLELFARDPETSETRQLTNDDEPVSLLAGANGGLLTWNFDSDATFAHFDFRNPEGSVLGTVNESEHGVSLYPAVSFSGEARGYFDGARFVAVGRNLEVFDSRGNFQPPDVDLNGRHNLISTVALTSHGFVYAAAPLNFEDYSKLDPADVFVWEPRAGHRRLTATAENERYVWADGELVYWTSENGVYRHRLGADTAPAKIHRGRCGPPHAIGRLVAFACEVSGGGETPAEPDARVPIPRPTQLILVDGSESRRIELDGERALIHSVRLTHSGVLWVEFDGVESICTGEGIGRVMYYHLDSEQQFEVGKIRPPAWCDESYLQINVSVDEGVMSWNRALSPTSAAQSGVGYAVVDTPPECR